MMPQGTAQQHVLPPGVRRLILSQLEQLSTTGRALVTGSVVIGQGASFNVLCRVAGVEERDALAALEEVLQQGQLREASEEDGRGQHSSVESYIFGGDYLQVLSESSQVVEGAGLLGDAIYLYLGYGFRAWAESRLGRHEEAMQSMARAQATSQRLGGQLAFQDLFAVASAELFLAAGCVGEGLTRAESAVELARVMGGNLSEGIAQRVWGQALACLPRWEEAELHLQASVQVLLSGEVLLEAARSQVAWGLLCRDRGDLASAQGHFEQAATQFEASGLTSELETVQSYLAH